MSARKGAKVLLQLPNGLGLLPDQLIHPLPLFILVGFPHCPLLLSPNLPQFSPFLAVDKPAVVCHPLLNRLYLSRRMMDLFTHANVSLSNTRHLHLKGKEGLKKGGVK